MSFDITKRHLKADVSKRSVFDESLATKTTTLQQPAKKSATTSKRPKTTVNISKGAAPPSNKQKEFNPYVNAVDESGRRTKVLKKQLKLASNMIDNNTSGILFNESDQIAIQNAQKKKKAKNVKGLSSQAVANLTLLTRQSIRQDVATKKSFSYANKLLADNRNGSKTWKAKKAKK